MVFLEIVSWTLQNILIWVSAVMFLIAIYFSYKLAKETKWEKYWIFFLVSALAMGVYHFVVELPWVYGFIGDNLRLIAQQLSEIIWAFSLAFASYGIYKSMRTIRRKLSKKV